MGSVESGKGEQVMTTDTKPMMACGHAANAVDMKTGQPVCAICVGLTADAQVTATAPDLTGRRARCTCGKSVPSKLTLAFFEYRGVGSKSADESCVCGFYRVAHEEGKVPECAGFVARGDVGYDSYYCGHAGWD